MKTFQLTLAALTLASVALTTGCMTRGERISEPSGAAAYRSGEWKPVDESQYRLLPNDEHGYYDGRGAWHSRH